MSEHVYFVIGTYNHAAYIKEAIHGAFAQTFSPLTILISDDYSTDNTFDIIQQEVAAYTGPHRIIVNRNEENMGLAKHINGLMERIIEKEPTLVVGAGGDDVSFPERTQVLYDAWKKRGFANISLFSDMQTVGEDGHTPIAFYGRNYTNKNLTAKAFVYGTFSVYGCTHAFTKGLFDVFGPLHPEVVREDAVIPFRSALLGGVYFIEQSLVLYRRTPGSAWKTRSQRTVDDVKREFIRHAKGNVAIAENQFSDLEQFLQHHACDDGDAIRSYLSHKLKHCRYEARLAYASSQLSRIFIILNAACHRISLHKLIKWFSIFFMPRLYLYRTTRQAQKRTRD